MDKKVAVALYDGQLRQLDDYIGQLMKKMEEWGILDNTLVFITSTMEKNCLNTVLLDMHPHH